MYCFAHGRESFFILFLLAGKMFTRLRSNNKYVCARIVSLDTENGSKHRIILCFNEFTLVINELALLTNITQYPCVVYILLYGVYRISVRCVRGSIENRQSPYRHVIAYVTQSRSRVCMEQFVCAFV